MPKGISTKDYIAEIEMPTTKQDKYMYQLIMLAKEILENVKKEDVIEIIKEEKKEEVVTKPKKSRSK